MQNSSMKHLLVSALFVLISFFGLAQNPDASIDSIFSSSGLCVGDTHTVCFQLTNAGNYAFDTVTITTTINGVPFNSPFGLSDTLQVGDDTLICLGQTFLNNNDTIVIYSSGPGNVADSFAGNDTSTYIVTLDTLPVVDAGAQFVVCLGDSITIGGSPTSTTGVNYVWSPTATLSSASIANPVATPLLETTYYVTVEDANGCLGNDSTTVLVDTIPVPQFSLLDTVCEGDTAQITASGGTNYVWSPSAFVADDTATTTQAFFASTSTIMLTVEDANGCADSANFTVPYHALPAVDAGPNDTICDGSSVTLAATGAQTYVWAANATLSSTSSATPTASPVVSTTYYITGTDVNGCVNNDSVTIYVNVLPAVDAGPDVEVCFDDSIQLGGNPSGPVGSSYSWNSPMIHFDTAANPYLEGAVAGVYNILLEVVDANGCESSDALVATVHSLPPAAIGNITTTICDGDSYVLSGSGGTSYQWAPGASLSSTSGANPVASPSFTTTYYLTVTDANGCKDSTNEELSVYPHTPANAGNDTLMCQQDSIQLQATGGVSYQWNNTVSLINGSTDQPTVSPVETSTYTVTVTDANGCSKSDEVLVVVKPIPNVGAGEDARICEGDVVKIGGTPTGPGNASFSWIPTATLSNPNASNPNASPLQTTTYFVTATTPFGCQDSSSMTVVVDTLPVVNVLTSPFPVCLGDTTSATVTAGFNNYSWTPDDGSFQQVGSTIYFYPESSTAYTLEVTDANGCKGDTNTSVEIWMLPVLDAGPKLEFCEGDSVLVLQEQDYFVDYHYSPGIGLSDSVSLDGRTWAYPTTTTTYDLTVTDTNGCKNSDNFRVKVNGLPYVYAGPDIDNCDIDAVYIGSDTTGNDPGAIYHWTPSDGLDNPYSPMPLLLFPENVTYVLEIQDSNGCYSYDSVHVMANCEPNIFIPNAFTPGVEGLNDEFKVVASGITEPVLKIYDRWGKLVFETDDLNVGWNGSYATNTGEIPQSVFYWSLTYKTDTAQKRSKDGIVTVLR